jgi:isocitrate lyase
MRILLLMAAIPLSGCVVGTIASTAVDVVTLPVKAVSAGVDAATTSQAEADQRRGRAIREAEQERGRQLRLLEQRCRRGRTLPADDCSLVAPR